MKFVEKVGLVKFDFLGLKTLTVLSKAEALIKIKDKSFDLSKILLNDKSLILVKTKNLEFKFPDSWEETYGDIYKLNSGNYTRLDGDYSYDFGYDEKGGMYSTNLLVKVLYVDCQTRENFKIIDLGTDYKSKLKELDLSLIHI